MDIFQFHIFTAEIHELFPRSICSHGLVSFRVAATLVYSSTPIGVYIPSTTLDPLKQCRFKSFVRHWYWDDSLTAASEIYNQAVFLEIFLLFAAF